MQSSLLRRGLRPALATGPSPLGVCRGLKENVAGLPSTSHVTRVWIPATGWQVDNVDGKRASVAIYCHLASTFSQRLGKEAAKRGLELYGEYVAEAQAHPGSHPNIDLLLQVLAADGRTEYELLVE